MKTSVFFFALIIAFVSCDEESSGSSEEVIETIKEISQVFRSKLNVTIVDDIIRLVNKTQTQCPDIEDRIDKTLEEIDTCMESIDIGSETFCSITRKNFLRCSEPARKAVAECLPEESKEIPTLVFKIILGVIDQACNSTVEQILELFNPCQVEEEFTTYEPCTQIRDVLVDYKDKLPSKALVCKTLPKVKQCAKAHQDASCKNPITRQAVLQFYDAIDEAITEDCQSINKT